MLSSDFLTRLEDLPEVCVKNEQGYYQDSDLQVKILQIFKLDDFTSELRVMDASNQIWFCQILNQKFRGLKENSYVRMRSVTIENHLEYPNTFGFKHYSNILQLPYPCKLARDMNLESDNISRQFDKDQLANSAENPIMHPLILSKPKDPVYTNMYLKTFAQIFEEDQLE